MVCIVLMAMSLSGCGRALQLLGIRHEAKPEMNVRTADAGSATAAVAAGRVHLEAGRTGQAIEEFQRALAAGAEIGPAANGMGVAYARLGQFEQAHRFFAEALAVDPENEKYQANMARLMRSSLLAERHETDFAAQVAARTLIDAHDVLPGGSQPVVASASDATDKSAVKAAATQGPASTITRVSRGEIMIRTAAPAGEVRSGALPVVGVRGGKLDNFRPAVRIEFSDQGKTREDDAAATDAAKGEAPAKTASAALDNFKPLVRIDFPTARNKP